MIQTQKTERRYFKDDLRFIIRKLSDMRADSRLLGFGADEDLIAAQSKLASLLGKMDGEDAEVVSA